MENKEGNGRYRLPGLAGVLNARLGIIKRRSAWLKKRGIDPEEKDLFGRFLRRLEEMLRNQAGIHIRLPSHVARPFNSIDLYSTGQANVLSLAANAYVTLTRLGFPGTGPLSGSASGADAIQANMPLVVPEGWRAEITRVSCSVMESSSTRMQDSLGNVRWRLVSRGRSLLPYNDVFPTAGVFGGDIGGATAPAVLFSTMAGSHLWPSAIQSGIHLVAGDDLSMQVRIQSVIAGGGTTQVIYYGMIAGWMYPIRADADGIRGTIQD